MKPTKPEIIVSGYRQIDCWRNLASEQEPGHFAVGIFVANSDSESVIEIGGGESHFGEAVQAQFVVDSGATHTVISGILAQRIGLPLDDVPFSAGLAGTENEGLFVHSSIKLFIGSKWQRVQCLVTFPINKPSENLLSIAGLLDDHMLCFTKMQLYLLEKTEPSD